MKIVNDNQQPTAGSTIPLGEAITIHIDDDRPADPVPYTGLTEQGAPSPQWLADHMLSRPLSDWELALGVVADDPKSLAWQLKAWTLICWGLGILTGVLVVAPLLRALVVYLGGG